MKFPVGKNKLLMQEQSRRRMISINAIPSGMVQMILPEEAIMYKHALNRSRVFRTSNMRKYTVRLKL
jgi:hypothetical protein